MLCLTEQNGKRMYVSAVPSRENYVMFMLIVLIAILTVPSSGQPAIGIQAMDVFMNWTINNRSNDSFRVIHNPRNEIVIGFLSYQTTGTPHANYSHRVRDIQDVSQGVVSFRLLQLSVADAGRYSFKIWEQFDVGGQILIIAVPPLNPTVTKLSAAAILGSDYRLNCSTVSNSVPSNHTLSMMSAWNFNQVEVTNGGRFRIWGTELTIINLTRQDSGTEVTCLAYEDMRAKSSKSTAEIVDVKFGPDNIQLSPVPSTIFEYSSINISCAADCNPPCSYQWKRDSSGASVSTYQTLFIDKANRSHADIYTCYASNEVIKRNSSRSTRVAIIYGPTTGQVILTPPVNPFEVQEYTDVTISCFADCSPICQYEWTGPVNLHIENGRLSLAMDRSRSGVYTCTAKNEQNHENYRTATTTVSVTVYYGPGDSLSVSPNFPVYNVSLGEMIPDIVCSATCNPQCNFSWYRNDALLNSHATLSIGMVQKSDRGNYTCKATTMFLGSMQTSSKSLRLNVFYVPEVDLQPELKPKTNPYIIKLHQTNVKLTCNVTDAYPPTDHFVWTKDGLVIQEQTSQNQISIVTKSTRGRWGCMGVNSKGNSRESLLDIAVHYGPMILNISSQTKIEGDTVSVVCNVDSSPAPSSVTWVKLNNRTFTRDGTELIIVRLDRRDQGTYECRASNTLRPSGQPDEILSGMTQFNLDVTYGAEIINLSVAEGNTVNENTTATLRCLVDSNPESTITWTKQGIVESLKTDLSVHESQLIIEHAECLDTANYTCKASNRLGYPVERKVPLYVTCHPRTDFRSPPVTKVYSKRYGNASLSYTVISLPEPTFNWTFIGNGSENKRLPDSSTNLDNGWQSVLMFKNLNISDFGFYKVIAKNVFPISAVEVFQLIPADIPEVPSNVTVTDVKQSSLTVQWVAGYNGGTEQTFHIMITASGVTRSMYAPDPGYGKSGTQTLEDLMPNTRYSIYMSANNTLGSSNVTNVIFQITLKVPDTSTSMPISAVAGGVAAGIVTILLVVIGIILWRRCQRSKESLDENGLNREHKQRKRSESGLVDNPVYDSSESGPAVVEYAAVVKPKRMVGHAEDPSKLYAQVEKTNKNKGKIASKGKPGKTSKAAAKGKQAKPSRRDVYENTPLPLKSSAENVYENPGQLAAEPSFGDNVYENPVASAPKGQLVNKDGLLYADLDIGPPTTKAGKPVIHGLENRTEYAEIAYGKRGESLPVNDEEKESGGTKKKNGTKLNTDE